MCISFPKHNFTPCFFVHTHSDIHHRIMSLYFNCGYARVAVYQIASKLHTENNWMKLEGCYKDNFVAQFHKRFQNRAKFSIQNSDNFVHNARKLLPMFHQRWNPQSARAEYHENFSQESLVKLTTQAKAMHSIQACKGCLRSFPLIQSKFPGNLKRDKENFAEASRKLLKRLKRESPIPLREAKKIALNVFESISDQFEESTGHSLTECLTSNPKSRLLARPTKQQQKLKRREQFRTSKQTIENDYKESSVSAVLATRTSKSQFNKIRIIQGYETPEQQAQPKSHTPTMDNVVLTHHTEDQLISEVESIPDGKINWSSLARKYGVRLANSDHELKNGGQVVKEYLKNKGVNVERFNTK